MKGILRALPPFAPDYSGVTGVFFTLGGVIIINGADGCIGNVTGYDEPRFFDFDGRIFSSGLKETQAITGDEDLLRRKIEDSLGGPPTSGVPLNFIVILGTPTSAVIASDHQSVSRVLMDRHAVPVFAIPTSGIYGYDKGASLAFWELARRVVSGALPPGERKGGVNIIGATPLDFWPQFQAEEITAALEERGLEVRSCWGMDNSFENVKNALRAEINLVVSVSGLRAAAYLKETYGMPYIAGVPLGKTHADLLAKKLKNPDRAFPGRKDPETGAAGILIVGEQVWANSLREALRLSGFFGPVRIASFFSMEKDWKEEGDESLSCETALRDLCENFKPAVVVGDPLIRPLVNDTVLVEVPHLAVSSRVHWAHDVSYAGGKTDLLEKILSG